MQIALTSLAVLLMAAGLLGSLVPLLPGTPLIVLGAFIYGWSTGFVSIGWIHLGVLTALALVAYLLEYVSTALGAKFGGSRWAMLGAVLGGLAGIFGGILGVLIGPIIGAVLLEWVSSREFQAGLRGGIGTAMGLLVGLVAKLSVAATMIGLVVYWTYGSS